MYLSFYKLGEEPFRLTPDPKFLHLAEPHRNVLTAVLQGVVHRKGCLVLTGPIGTGKTTIIHTALQMLSKRLFGAEQLLSALVVNPVLGRDDFLEMLLHEFEISAFSATKPGRLQSLYESILAKHRKGGTSVVFIDEAHLLSVDLLEEIRLLTNVDTYKEKPLQIVLVGQPELAALIRRPEVSALQQRVARYCQLRPLSSPEMRAYIAERLLCAGLAGSGPFEARALEEIFLYSQGVPRLVNLVCDNALMIGFESHRTRIEADIIQAAAESLGLARAEARDAGKARPAQTSEAAPGLLSDLMNQVLGGRP